MSSRRTPRARSEGADDGEDTRQVTIEELGDELEQCEAIAEYTSERCRLPTVSGTPYCPFHNEDLEPIGGEDETD